LSIGQGRDGKTLLRCHAGCELPAIVAALGLDLRDLFPDERAPGVWRATRAQHTSADDIERALQQELEQIVAADSERCGFDVVELARHRNEARTCIDRRYDVHLKQERAPWWEIDPHALDPAWLACVGQAMRVVAARGTFTLRLLNRSIADFPKTQHVVLKLARRFQRELAQPAAPLESAA